jgi:aspartokinase-like uncharacterized kinase
MIVVKIGGSLYNTPELKIWLHTLANSSHSSPIVIVPGGGPFADQVRRAQEHHHFNDTTAHHMALVAMKQFGLMLISLEAKCQPFNSQEPLPSLSVWLPDDSLLSESTLLPNWDLSSDSLALWLASKLNAKQLLLVKHVDIKTTSIQQLTVNQVIDRHFCHLFKQFPIPTQIIHFQSYSDFAAIVASDHTESGLYLP